jgi:hypothetical protein
MLSSTMNRVESLLQTIDKLGIVKIKHLQEIHDLKSYRNTCRVINHQLRPYIHESYFQREKVMYLNKKGRELIASEKDELKISQQTIHYLLRNEVYIHFQCPGDWKNEFPIETNVNGHFSGQIVFNGLTLSNKKKIVPDAVFTRNGYQYLIEVDNTQEMRTNKKKIDSYKEIMPYMKNGIPILYFFTTTENRKKKLAEWLKGIRHEVMTFHEIN